MGLKSRIIHTMRLIFIRSGSSRGEYLKENKIMKYVGDNVVFMPRKVPLYPQLIKLHDNVRIASRVTFITHDGVYAMLNNKQTQHKFQEKIGCIEIMENVVVGSNSTIMYDVKIGANCIIAAGSVVTKDVPENSIMAGIPAKKISTLDEYIDKILKNEPLYPEELKPRGQDIPKKLMELMWDKFDENR